MQDMLQDPECLFFFARHVSSLAACTMGALLWLILLVGCPPCLAAQEEVPTWAVVMIVFLAVVTVLLCIAVVLTRRALGKMQDMLQDVTQPRALSGSVDSRHTVVSDLEAPMFSGHTHPVDAESSGFHTPQSQRSDMSDIDARKEGQLLDPRERQAVEHMRSLVPPGAQKAYTIFGAHECHDNEFFLRFLRARDFDLDKASGLMLSYLEWRRKVYPQGAPTHIVEPRTHFGAVYADYLDKKGRPVLVVRARYHDKTRSTEETRHVIVMFMDGIVHHIHKPATQFSVLVDLNGFGYANADLTALKSTLSILDNYFPERLGNLWFIHANFVFMSLWKVVKSFIPVQTASKIFFYGPDYQERLRESIDPRVLPNAYGGQEP
uniref:CRAL-TRIO domain-containing protein n=1 Tax=Eutreptiella gymnastica TaxID=73025 RepID=A0A7S1IMF2_9EUGL|mmetsp:Transcript_29199/g.52498  ORF Transcript_29199/g.52498 Transcript_29199/m.52498 type:complete len:378 (+) Transcript_29199:3-1136(+)